MLTTLIETRHHRQHNLQAQMVSVAVHTGLILAAVVATQRAAATLEPVVPEAAPRVWLPESPPPAPSVPTIDPSRLKGFRLLPPIFDIPSVLPEIDLRRPFTNPDDFIPRGQAGGDPRGVEPTTGTGVMTAEQVDRPAFLMRGSGRPVFPEALRRAGVGGEVSVQFVIDSMGRADMRTLTILASSHDRFTESVTRALEKARFAPAEFGGRRVPQIVRMPFVFSLSR